MIRKQIIVLHYRLNQIIDPCCLRMVSIQILLSKIFLCFKAYSDSSQLPSASNRPRINSSSYTPYSSTNVLQERRHSFSRKSIHQEPIENPRESRIFIPEKPPYVSVKNSFSFLSCLSYIFNIYLGNLIQHNSHVKFVKN